MADEDDTAAEVRRLRRLITAVVAVVALVVVWKVVDDAERRSDRQADEIVECIRSGREDC